MLERIRKLRRTIGAIFRSVQASLRGPELSTTKMKHVFASFGAQERKKFTEVTHDDVHVYFRKKAFKCMKRTIANAKKSIDMRMFIWLADGTGRSIASLLVTAARRGVQVKIHKEMIGDIFEFADDFATTKNDPHPIWKAFWHHPNITVIHKNNHDHSKTFIVDDEILLVSSMNIGDAYCNNWHECLVELRGRRFVEEYLSGEVGIPRQTKRGNIKVLRSSLEHPMLPAVLSLIHSATKSIRIEMAYFSDQKIVEVLAKKSRDGVFLFLVIPHSPDVHRHSNLAAVEKLLKLGDKNRMFIFRYTRGLLHTKMIIIDRKTLFIGSTNLITSSLTKMCETNVLIHRHPHKCLRIVRRQFAKDVFQSVKLEASEITRTSWQKFLTIFGL